MEGMISVLKTCLSVCIAFAVLFFVISVILFFLFDIRTIFNIRTGRAKKKTVQEMQEANSKTGRLRVDGKTITSQLSKEERQRATKGATKRNKIVSQPVSNGYQNSYKPNTTQENEAEQYTELLQQQTEVLRQNSTEEYSVGSAPTTQLSQTNNAQPQNQSYQFEKVRDVHFVVTKKVVVINTDEMLM